jgi:surfeit locus 1 family protein
MTEFHLRRPGIGGTGVLARTIGFRLRLWPTMFAVPAFLLLVGLGIWQLQRLQWKEGLIAERQAATHAAPAPLPQSREISPDMAFRHVFVRGVFRNAKEILVYAAPRAGMAGFDVLTPLVEASGRVVFINRGFVPPGLRDPAMRAAGEIAGPVEVKGLLRLPPKAKPNWFVPDNDPRRGRWFWVDLKAMAAADRLPLDKVLPFYIDADATPNPGGWPRGGLTHITLPNHHLQYALTWFFLAIALLMIYVLAHCEREQDDRLPPP